MDQFLTVTSRFLGILAVVSLVYPLGRCWKTHRRTSLRHASWWFLVAWAGWLVVVLSDAWGRPLSPWHYLALCLSACALVAVLGARQPGMAAWNFVVGGLLAILSLPLLEQSWRAPNWQLDEPRTLFVGLVLAVGVGNYLLTRWTWVMLMAALWWAAELQRLAELPPPAPAAYWCVFVAASVWLAAEKRPQGVPGDEVATLWLNFRDSFGVVWALRAREQFNHAMQNAGLPGRLTWRGLTWPSQSTPPTPEHQQAALQTLQATVKRFGEATDVT